MEEGRSHRRLRRIAATLPLQRPADPCPQRHSAAGGGDDEEVGVETVDIASIVAKPGDEALRLIELEQLASDGAITQAEAEAALLEVLGVAVRPSIDPAAVSGSEYIEAHSAAGAALLAGCTNPRVAARTASVFEKQETDTSCGIVSSGVGLLATGTAALPSPQMRDVFTLPATSTVLSMQTVIDEGSTLDEVALVLERNGAGAVATHHADAVSVDEFRAVATAALGAGMAGEATAQCVIINYDMAVLAEVTGSQRYLIGLPNPDHVSSGELPRWLPSGLHSSQDGSDIVVDRPGPRQHPVRM
eukprot:COSAG04_NODE_6572_length_1302_cov_3.059019_1_plen_303_part_00